MIMRVAVHTRLMFICVLAARTTTAVVPAAVPAAALLDGVAVLIPTFNILTPNLPDRVGARLNLLTNG